MRTPTQTAPDYRTGFNEVILDAFKRYTAKVSSAYLMPRLRPGMNVIDVGCGPGNISVGLAEAVAPGEMHGVDVDEAKIDLARSIARGNRQNNAFFHVADPLELPFENDAFDVAHCHNVLTYVEDTQAALAEIRRVLKPGGIIGCREVISESSFTQPDFGILRSAWDMFEDVLTTDDAHPQMGKELKGRLDEAGFESIQVSASFDVYNTPDDIEFIYMVAHQWFMTPEMMEAAIGYGAATQELCDNIRNAYARWKDYPGAFCAVAWGETIAVNP